MDDNFVGVPLIMKQASSGIILELTATFQGQPVTFPEGTTGEFRAYKGDNTYIDRTEGVTVSDQLTTIEITANTLAVAGEITCDVIFANAGNTLGVVNFTVIVAPGAIPLDAVQSQDDWQALAQAATAAANAATQATESATQAENSATQAAESETQAGSSAQQAASAASEAQSYSSHPPDILTNGNWGLWNGTEYEDSGKPSQGPQGPSGVVQEIVPGSNIEINDSNPASPVVSATGLMQTSTYDPAGYSRQLAAETYPTLTTTDKTVPGAINELNEAIAAAGGSQILLSPVVSTTQPESPQNLTCWINSDVTMTSWYYGPLTNTIPSQGLLNLQDTGSIVLPITNTSHEMEQLGNAYIYNNQAWESAPMQIYYDGNWLTSEIPIFSNGSYEQETTSGSVSGGFADINGTVSIVDGNMRLSAARGNNNYWGGIYDMTAQTIDLTGYSSITATAVGGMYQSGFVSLGVAVLEQGTIPAMGTSSPRLTNAVAQSEVDVSSVPITVTLDVSSLSGEYVVAVIHFTRYSGSPYLDVSEFTIT